MAKIKSMIIGSKKSRLMTLALLVLLVGGIGVFAYSKQKDANGTAPTVQLEGDVNLNPPTTKDKQDVDRNKQSIVDREKSLQSQQVNSELSDKKTVTPAITYSGQYGNQIEVGAYVNGVFEDNGVCTLAMQKDNRKITKSVTAVKNVSSVDCPVMSIPRSSLEAGNWEITVSYLSNTAEGLSPASNLTVK